MKKLTKKQRFITKVEIYRYKQAGMGMTIVRSIAEANWKFIKLLNLEENRIGWEGMDLLTHQCYKYLQRL